jgi:hypothetical protein
MNTDGDSLVAEEECKQNMKVIGQISPLGSALFALSSLLDSSPYNLWKPQTFLCIVSEISPASLPLWLNEHLDLSEMVRGSNDSFSRGRIQPVVYQSEFFFSQFVLSIASDV